MKGHFISLACFHLGIFLLLLYLHLFMHQGKIEIYQGARPCLCWLHGSRFWKRGSSLKPLGQELMGKFERERERAGWQSLWCTEIDNIKGSLTQNALSGHNTSVVLCYWMVQPLGWIWSRWLQIVFIPEWIGISFWKMMSGARARNYLLLEWTRMLCGAFLCFLFSSDVMCILR